MFQVERMNRIIEIMEGVKRHKKTKMFDMGGWIDKIYDNNNEFCGTSCCIMGYAALDPQLQKEGLHLDVYVVSAIDNGEMKTITSQASFNRMLKKTDADIEPTVTYDDAEGFHAAKAFFGISSRCSDWLFGATYYKPDTPEEPTIDEAIKRLKAVRDDNGRMPRWSRK